jgi:DNA topoisomerase-1
MAMAQNRKKSGVLTSDPRESAKAAGLRYVIPEGPGIVRKSIRGKFSYIGVDGRPVRDKNELARFRSLVIPPAWTDVWICPFRGGHLQVVGRDARGRKQYRYHPLYRQIRDATKFGRMAAFAAVLPRIRERVEADLSLPGLPKEKVLATAVRLLETTAIRVGNEEYARSNDSYGLTTLKEQHVEILGRRLRFHFRGKSGLVHDIELTDRKLAKILLQSQCIAGEELFHFVDDNETVCRIHSEDVNDYIREIAGEDFTAKDFRTWIGTGQAVLALEELGPGETATEAKAKIVTAIRTTARKLGNRPATCRKYYVHPAILEAYAQGRLLAALQHTADSGRPTALRREELAVLAILKAERNGIAKAA